MTKRTHDVQVPGAPADEPKQPGTDLNASEVQARAADAGADQTGGESVEDLRAQLAALQAENTALKAKPAKDEMIFANPTGKYADVHSSKVDKTKITAPVLCKDGWLVP